MFFQSHVRPSMRLAAFAASLAAVAMLAAACSPFTIVSSQGSQPTPVEGFVTAAPTGAPGEPRPAQIDRVEVEVGVGSPVPVYAIVGGVLPSPCDQLAQVMQEHQGAEFRLSVLTTTPADAACAPDALPFIVKIPLNVVNLGPGEYAVDANGTRATFKLDAGSDSPIAPQAGAAPTIREAQIDDVNVEIGVGSPIPVHVIVSGNLPDTCAQLGEIQLRRVGTTGVGFHIGVMTHTYASEGCVPDSVPFRLEFPLNVVSLSTGPYNVSVNGVTASFDPRAVPAPSTTPAQVDHVEVEIGEGSPIPVTLIVDGQWLDACGQLAEVRQRFDGLTVEVSVEATGQPGVSCLPDTAPFRIRIPLNAVALQQGAYTVVANGVSTTFDWPHGGAASTPAVSAELRPLPVDRVEVQSGVGSPVPVMLIVHGQLPESCSQLAEIAQRIDGARVEITLQAGATQQACTPDSVPFRLTIPLNAVSLQEGAYTVSVNGVGASFDWPMAAFEGALLWALAERDGGTMQALMGEPFMIGFWQSEGVAYSKPEAVTQLLTHYVKSGSAVAFQNFQGLPGFDPQTVVGPDVELAKTVLVTGWGPDGRGEALLFIARRSDKSFYWQGVLVTPEGFAPPAGSAGSDLTPGLAALDALAQSLQVTRP